MNLKLPTSTVEWTAAERLAWLPPDDLSVSEWANRHRILHPLTSAEPGRWRTDRTPYLKAIMDSFSDPKVERITLMASTQVGKTETILNMMAYAVDQDPGAMLLVMPREEDTVSIGQRRIRPMIESSPQLSRHLSDHKTDNKLKEIRFARSMLYFAGSNSPADLASRPVRYVLLDEVDKYPAFTGQMKEAGPIDLAVERTRTFWNRKIVLCSTPTTRAGHIFREFERSDQRTYHVPCPHCGHRQTLEFSQIKWPEDERDPVKIRRDRLAWYECNHCEEVILDTDKPEMLNQGEWRTADGADEDSPHRGFRIHALYSPWLTFSEVAAKFLESKDDPPSLLNFVNSWLGWIWEERSEKIEADHVATRAKEYDRATVPEGGIVLTAGVDVQQDHLYYTVRAWGLREESWLVECGRLEAGLDQLVNVLLRRTWNGHDRTHRLRLCCIDSGYRTDEVYRFARSWPDLVRPIKGAQRLSGVPIRAAKIDRNIVGDPLKRSVRLFHLDTSHFKDKLTRFMTAQDGEHGAWHLHAGVPAEYLKQVTSEHKILNRNRKTGASVAAWTKRPGAGGNHWWDCEVYAAAAADMLAIYALNDENAPEGQPPTTQNSRPDASRSSGWVRQKRGGWFND